MNELLYANEKLRAQANDNQQIITRLRTEYHSHENLIEAPPCLEQCRNAREAQKDTELLHTRLRDIAQAVINDDQAFGIACDDRICAGSLSPRSRSPIRRAPSNGPHQGSRPVSRNASPFADATFSAVQAALNKRQLQIHDLKTKLDASRDTNINYKKQIDELDNEKRRLEQTVNDLHLQFENVRRSATETCRERDQSKQQLETSYYEKTNLEKVRQALVSQSESLRFECEKLQAANTELQRHRDQLEDEKDDIIKDKIRQVKENERCYKVIEQLEMKISALRKELTDERESLNRTKLERDVTLQDKNVTAEALSRAEILNAELELDMNKMKTEELKLRDILHKMQNLNEGLGADKADLNKIISCLEQDKNILINEKNDLEMIKGSLKAELVKVEQEKQDLENDRESNSKLISFH
jgi:hypothetical protein